MTARFTSPTVFSGGAFVNLILCASAGLIVVGCQARASSLTSSDESAIRAASQKYVQAALAGDDKASAELVSADAIYMPRSAQLVEGRDAVIAFGRSLPRMSRFEVTPREIIGRDDLAVVRGSYAVTTVATSQAPAVDDTGNYIEVWQRQPDGEWRIFRNIWTTDQPQQLPQSAARPGSRTNEFPDAVKSDPAHYKVEFENELARVLRINYGGGEKSVMHTHPANCRVILTNQSFRFTTPDGTPQEISPRVGEVGCGDAEVHLPENIGRTAGELVLVEFKNRQTFKP